MKKSKKIICGGILALFLAVMSVVPAFANCRTADLARFNLMRAPGGGDFKVKCVAKLVLDGGNVPTQVYGKTQADCSKAAALAANPEGCETDDLNNIIQAIINTVIFAVGIIAVIMVILGGIQYSTSQGAADKVKKAKDTIMYGIIGLVVAILAFAIVNFVLGSLFT